MTDRPVRRGLVLGAGGVLGAAWTIGALCALDDAGVDVVQADHILGTSAGAVLAALLGGGITPAQLAAHQLGQAGDGPLGTVVWDYETATGGSRPPLPRPGFGSPRLVARNIRRLRRLPPTAVLTALLPAGRGSTDAIAGLVGGVSGPDGWVARDGVAVVAMNYDNGHRVAFGRPGAPRSTLVDAVTASCAIPAWYAPVVIDGARYVDGGACSPASADLMRGLGLDEVYVLAPGVSAELDRPRAVVAWLERRWRARMTRRCLREVAKLRRDGVRVTVLGPGAADLEAIGGNVMDVSRRRRVLETSLRTSARAVTALRDGGQRESRLS